MYHYKAKVLKVIDGDTIEVELDLGFRFKFTDKIRLLGINTPEIHGENKSNGLLAKARTEQLAPVGSIIEIKTHKDQKEKYGRYLAEVILSDGRILNQVLVSEGLAIQFMIGS